MRLRSETNMNNFSYSSAFSFSIVSNLFVLIKVGDTMNEKQLYLSNTKMFSFKNAVKKYINLEKNQQDQFHQAVTNVMTLSYWISAIFWKYLSQNLASNTKEKSDTPYFPIAAACPKFQTPKYTSDNLFTQFLPIIRPSLQRKYHPDTVYVLVRGCNSIST